MADANASAASPAEIAAEIRRQALAIGFDSAGFAAAAHDSEQRRRLPGRLQEFLAAGLQGDMGWLAANAERRSDPRILWPQAQSILMLGLRYTPDEDPLQLLAQRDRGAISVYARSRDYHDVVKARLKQLGRWIADRYRCQLKVFVDTAPVLEKPLAQAAGLGWQGKHTNLVSRERGSWLFLGAVFLDLALPPDPAEDNHCGSCRACLDICPTQAFPSPYRLDPRRCISYLTIEHRGPIPRQFRAALGNRIYGCDDCLAVCPWNKFAAAGREAALEPRQELAAPRLVELAALDDAAFRRLFAGTAIKRTGRDRFVRNVALALGNSGDADQALPALRRLAEDVSPLVRGAAAWAIGRLATPPESAALASDHLARETDQEVRAEWQALLPFSGAA